MTTNQASECTERCTADCGTCKGFAVKRGFTFHHDRFREHVDGVRVADSPYVAMHVTRVTATRVWYGHLGSTKAQYVTDRASFMERFGSQL